jgi:hypothetical protein
MSKRTNFTVAIAKLIILGIDYGLDLVLDWVLRDAETQRRMFDKGLSKCDGTTKRSKHQSGCAADLYIISHGKISDNIQDYEWLHEQWVIMGGAPMIKWDMGHFEWDS